MSTLFEETLPEKTAKLVKKIQETKAEFIADFYLSGGTALSLQLGHRKSEDLDFFSKKTFNPELLQSKLVYLGKLNQTEIAEGSLNTYIDGVQMQFLEYPYQLLENTVDFGGIKLSSMLDIACTKLITVSSRGSKKDFVDLYFIFEKFGLDVLFRALEKKYEGIDYNIAHILKSLVYFEVAEDEPMPRMQRRVEWSEVKEKMRRIVKSYKF